MWAGGSNRADGCKMADSGRGKAARRQMWDGYWHAANGSDNGTNRQQKPKQRCEEEQMTGPHEHEQEQEQQQEATQKRLGNSMQCSLLADPTASAEHAGNSPR